MKIRKLYNPDTNKWCVELWIASRSFKLSGFWFGKSLLSAQELENAKRYREAIRAYKKENTSKSWNQAGVVAGKYLKKYREAERYYRRSLDRFAGNASTWYNRACNEIRRNNFKKSCKYLKCAIDINRSRYEALIRSDEVFSEYRDRIFEVLGAQNAVR
jgi:tetratricopeptide (TPR) repeat protein